MTTESVDDKKMSVMDVRARVEIIGSLGLENEEEIAHRKEDELHQDVLRAIASGNVTDARDVAREALSTLQFDHDRWYS